MFEGFTGTVALKNTSFNPDALEALLKPKTLVIHMTRGESRVRDELNRAFAGVEHVIIDVDGERHEYDADTLIRLLESYEKRERELHE